MVMREVKVSKDGDTCLDMSLPRFRVRIDVGRCSEPHVDMILWVLDYPQQM